MIERSASRPRWITPTAANTDFTETVAEFLSGRARIAALWDDLNATTGLVLASPAHNSMTIHYISVPEFGTGSPNYFSVRMEENGRVTLSYEGVLSHDSIVGITAGGGVANPGLTDLSSSSSHSRKGTTYEQFTAGFNMALPLLNPFDLPFLNIPFQ